MKGKNLWVLLACLGMHGLVVAGPPVISRVRVAPPGVGHGWTIVYDLTGTTAASNVELALSRDGGATFTVPVTSATGAVGAAVAAGLDRQITWNAAVDFPASATSEMVVRLVAGDGSGQSPASFVEVPAGPFLMGDERGEGDADEWPVRNVMTSRYLMEKTKVSWQQWRQVAEWAVAHGYGFGGGAAGKGADHPVHGINWYDAVKWCNARSEMELLTPCYRAGGAVYRSGARDDVTFDPQVAGYRLPTEAEWEKAARGGDDPRRFPWGDTISFENANYQAERGSGVTVPPYDVETGAGYHPDWKNGGYPYTNRVGAFDANSLGLRDMAGNLWEWCWDWYGPYSGLSVVDPAGPYSGASRVVRGGSWFQRANYLRVANRGVAFYPSSASYYQGMRTAMNGYSNLSEPFLVDTRPALWDLAAQAPQVTYAGGGGVGWRCVLRNTGPQAVPLAGVTVAVVMSANEAPGDTGDVGAGSAVLPGGVLAPGEEVVVSGSAGVPPDVARWPWLVVMADSTAQVPETDELNNVAAVRFPTSAAIQLDGDLAFGPVEVGKSAVRTMTIHNPGTAALTVGGIVWPAGFAGDWTTGTVAAGATRLVNVTFSPTLESVYGGQVSVSSDAAAGSPFLACSGTGSPPPPPVFMIWPPTSFPASQGTRYQIVVDASDAWTVRSNQPWVRVAPAGGASSGTVEVTVDANLGPGERVAQLDFDSPGVGSEIHVVRQVQADVAPPEQFVLVPAGSFAMGDALDGMGDAPVHPAEVSGFLLSNLEVTQELWEDARAWGLANGYTDLPAGAGTGAGHPVQGVNWRDMAKWCNARSEKDGLTPCYTVSGVVYQVGARDDIECRWNASGYRLPTEAEWEKAARGGAGGQRFPWGDTISHGEANFTNSGGESYASGTTGPHPAYWANGAVATAPAGSFAPNGFGLHDMAGNVAECVWDWYAPGTYTASPATDPRGPAGSSSRVVRGGAWSTPAEAARVARRDVVDPAAARASTGFRLALAAIQISRESAEVPAAGGQVQVGVDGLGAWSAASDQAWASVSQASGFGYAAMAVNVAPNTGTSARSASIRIGGQSLLITQQGTLPTPVMQLWLGSADTGTPVTGSANFGARPLGSSPVPLTFSIRNAGTADLTGIAVTLGGGGDFALDTAGTAASLAPGGSTTFRVSFLPTAIGSRLEQLGVASSDSARSPFPVLLSGQGIVGIANFGFETDEGWVLTEYDPSGELAAGYSGEWASEGLRCHRFSRGTGPMDGGWIQITASDVDMDGVSGLLFDCQDTGIDPLDIHFVVDGVIVASWHNNGWPGGAGTGWGNTAETRDIRVPFGRTFAGRHEFAIRIEDGGPYFPSDEKIYRVDNIRFTSGQTVIDPPSQSVGPAAQSYPVTVTSNGSWAAVSDQAWATVSPPSGSGNGTVTVTVEENTAATSRAATITIGGQPHGLTQLPAPQLAIEPASQAVDSTAQTYQILVRSNTNWSVEESLDWAAAEPMSGTGDATVRVTVDANPGPERSGTITFSAAGLAPRPHTLTQAELVNNIGTLTLLSGGSLNGQRVDAGHSTVVVAPGQAITGQIRVQANNLMPSSAVVPLGGTVVWGDRTTQSWQTAGDIPPGVNQYTMTVSKTAPTTPGTYHIVLAFAGEFNMSQIMSRTNWGAGAVVWNDGNDVGFDWSAADFAAAAQNGAVVTPILLSGGVKAPSWLPAAVITVTVADGSSFGNWMGSYFPGETNPLVVGAGADPNRDGVENLLSYGLEVNPREVESGARGSLPVTSLASGALELRFQRPATGRGDISYVIQQSVGGMDNWVTVAKRPPGGVWSDAPATVTEDAAVNGMVPVRARATLTTAQAPVLFLRLVVVTGEWVEPLAPEMMLIPAGEFLMGDQSNPLVGNSDELPVHSVYVSAFYMAKHEVTKELWDSVRAWGLSNGYTDLAVGNGSYASKGANHPVHMITWYDMVKWCNARSAKEGLTPCYYTDAAQTVIYKTGNVDIDNTMVKWTANGYRLPTEAEWEKAARGGVVGRNFPWGGDTISHSQANYRVYSSNGTTNFYTYDVTPRPPGSVNDYFHPNYAVGGYPYSSPVGSSAPNGYGLYDMAGNMGQWCWDRIGSYLSVSQTDPRGPASGSRRVYRGGSWFGYAYGARCAFRGYNFPYFSDFYVGVRLARSAGGVEVSPNLANVTAAGGPVVVNVAAIGPWAVASDQPWATVNRTSGTGNGTVTVTVATNTVTSPRNANIMIGGRVVVIAQAAAAVVTTINPTSNSINHTAQNYPVTVTSNGAWNASSDQAWATVSPPSGNGNGTVTVTVAANPSTTAGRSATITIGGQTHNLTQGAAPVVTTINPTSNSINHTAQQYGITVTSNGAWNAGSNQPWATVSPPSGNGNGTVTVTVTANPSTTASRGAIITIGGQPHNLTQGVAPVVTTINPTSNSINHTAQNYPVTVTSNGAWNAGSNQPWATVSPPSGNGNGTVTVTVEANSSTTASRGAIITIGGQPHNLTQGAAPVVTTIDPGSKGIDYTAQQYGITVTSNGAWSASSDQAWATVSPPSGNGNGTVTVTVEANPSNESGRGATITIGGVVHSLTQDPGPELVLIPVAEFGMGNALAASGDGDVNELPVHPVLVSDYLLGRHEVTKGLWDSVRAWAVDHGYNDLPAGSEAAGTNHSKGPDHPVHLVSWSAMVKWCNARSEMEDLTPCYYTDAARLEVYRNGEADLDSSLVRWTADGYRLPTEAEWEKAARGGLADTRFPWGDTIRHSQANYFVYSENGTSNFFFYDESLSRGFHPKYNDGVNPFTAPAGSFAPNGYGLYDMAGNVWEECWDRYAADYYSSSPGVDPRGPAAGSGRVLRGGAWNYYCYSSRNSVRTFGATTAVGHDVGFRVARSAGGIDLSPSIANVAAAGGPVVVNVGAFGAWTASSDQSWATVNPTTGNGDGAVTVTVGPNPSTTSPRVAYITIGGQKVTIQQEALGVITSIDPASNSVDYTAQDYSITVTSNGAWNAASDQAWATVSPPSGTGNDLVTVTVDENPSTTAGRNATITIGGQTHSLSQAAAPVDTRIYPVDRTLDYKGQDYTITVTSNGAWNAGSDQAWATVSPLSGDGNGIVTVTVTENLTGADRQAEIMIGGQSHSLTQQAVETTIDPTGQVVDYTAQSYPIAVVSNGPWTAASDQLWATVSPSSGSGNGTVTVTVEANSDIFPRSAAVTIGGQVHSVGQLAAPYIVVDPDSLQLLGSGGDSTLRIDSNTSWTVESDQTWLVPDPLAGTGPSQVLATVAPNPSPDPRVGILAFRTPGGGSAQVTVVQLGAAQGFVWIPGGTFDMGSPVGELGRDTNENQHKVTVSPFLLDTTEITWSKWNEVRAAAGPQGYSDIATGTNGSGGDASGTHPVVQISWWDAVKWCNLRSQVEGRRPVYYTAPDFAPANVLRTGAPQPYADWNANGYRLASESEWEFACRAGTTTAFYTGPITNPDKVPLDPNLDIAAWYGGNSGSATHPVGQKPVNPFGLRDIHGNAWEWCWDGYAAYPLGPVTDPRGDDASTNRIFRGGGWNGNASRCRSAVRGHTTPDNRFGDVGLRVALSAILPAPLSVAPTAADVAAAGGIVNVNVTAGHGWTVSSDRSWAKVSPASGNGNGSVAITVEPNPLFDPRTATITIGGQKVVVSQDGVSVLATYQAWTAAWFPGVTDPLVVGAAADPNRDGVENLLAYGLGIEPHGAGTGRGSMPQAAMDPAGERVELRFWRPAEGRRDISYVIQQSVGSLNGWATVAKRPPGGVWSDVPAVVTEGAPVNGMVPVRVLATLTKAQAPVLFLRLAVVVGEWVEPLVPEMMLIPAGEFLMGDQSSPAVGAVNELPVHMVQVSAFYMAKYEVTKELWDDVKAWGLANGYTDLPAGGGKAANHPVHSISWHAMVRWCNARSQKENLTPCYRVSGAVYKTAPDNDAVTCDFGANGYRLPTEAEWEKAARGGATGLNFPWGNTINHSFANYYNYNYSYESPQNQLYHPTYAVGDWPYSSPVGSFAPNGYGLYDMAGNMWEWCWDWYSSGYYTSSPGTDPRGPSSGSNRVFRGGGWRFNAVYCRAAYRYSVNPGSYVNNFGFRTARSSVP